MTDVGELIEVEGIGIQLTVDSGDPAANFTVTIGGSVEATDDGIFVGANPADLVATGTFVIENSGLIRSTTGHAIHFDLAMAAPGSIAIVNNETGILEVTAGNAILVERDAAASITNRGQILGGILTSGGADTFELFTGSSISGLLDAGGGTDTINLRGSGAGSLGSFANVEAINLFDGDWTLGSEGVAAVNFQAGAQTLGLAAGLIADGSFSSTINGFQLGDVINLEGIGLATTATLGPGNVLTIAGGTGGPVTLQLDPLQDFSGGVFRVASDGAGGTNVRLSSVAEIDNSGTIISSDAGILITISELDPSASYTITNSGSGSISGDVDGIRVIADPSDLAATGIFAIDNSGTIQSAGAGHAILFDLNLAPPGGVSITNQASGVIATGGSEAIAIAGTTADVITNFGSIVGGVSTGDGADTFELYTGSSISGVVNAGNGSDTANLRGTGQGTLASFAGLEFINLFGGDWTLGSEDLTSVSLQTGAQTLGLAASTLADGSFDGTIKGFELGDVINLEGIGLKTTATLGAGNVLTLSGGPGGPITLQLDPSQSFAGTIFQLASDGAGGTNLMRATVVNSGNGSDVVVGTVGNDLIDSGNGDDTVQSGDGDDTISTGNGNDTVIAGNGNNVINGENGNDTITAGNGNNVISGANGNDVLTVGDGNNTVSGGNGNDRITVGSGNNLLTGNNGNDAFVFGPDFGLNTITDFERNDKIEIAGVFDTFQEVLAASQQVGANTVIALDADHAITLLNVSLSSLKASNFVLGELVV